MIASATAIVAAAVVAGCGGSNPLSPSELISKGDALCAQGQKGFADVQAQPPANALAVVDQTGKLIDVATSELNGLRNLTPPQSLKATYEQYLQAKQAALGLLTQGREAAQHQDSRRYAALQQQAASTAPDRLKLAHQLGFKVCSAGQPASHPRH